MRKLYIFHWNDGSVEQRDDTNVTNAFRALGYSADALPTLDFYEETPIPYNLNELDILLRVKKGHAGVEEWLMDHGFEKRHEQYGDPFATFYRWWSLDETELVDIDTMGGVSHEYTIYCKDQSHPLDQNCYDTRTDPVEVRNLKKPRPTPPPTLEKLLEEKRKLETK